jgi:hypothetical protein
MKKKVQAIFLQIQHWSTFSPKTRTQIVQKKLPHSPIEHQKTKTKSLRIRPTMVTLILSQYSNQQQSRDTSLSNTMIANGRLSSCNFFLEFGKKYPTMAMLTMAIALLRRKYEESN